MNLLRVENLDLKSLAADCDSWSAEVAVEAEPATPDQSVQSTVAAVRTVHDRVRSAGDMLSARMRSTATALTQLTCAHTAQDGDAAVTLGGLAIGR